MSISKFINCTILQIKMSNNENAIFILSDNDDDENDGDMVIISLSSSSDEDDDKKCKKERIKREKRLSLLRKATSCLIGSTISYGKYNILLDYNRDVPIFTYDPYYHIEGYRYLQIIITSFFSTKVGYDKRPYSTIQGARRAILEYFDKYEDEVNLIKIEMDGSIS
jgi:predicted type IV restriction endonuclease